MRQEIIVKAYIPFTIPRKAYTVTIQIKKMI